MHALSVSVLFIFIIAICDTVEKSAYMLALTCAVCVPHSICCVGCLLRSFFSILKNINNFFFDVQEHAVSSENEMKKKKNASKSPSSEPNACFWSKRKFFANIEGTTRRQRNAEKSYTQGHDQSIIIQPGRL